MPHSDLEISIVRFFAWLAGQSTILSEILSLLVWNDLVKGTPIALAVFLLWAAPRKDFRGQDRLRFIRLLFIMSLALTSGRVIQAFLHSPRPIMEPAVRSLYPRYLHSIRSDLNSFPSDHLTLFFSAALLVMPGRPFLRAFFIFWSLLIGAARISFGYHYPIDVLGGMVLAVFAVSAVSLLDPWLNPIYQKILNSMESHPHLSAAVVFLICTEVAVVFDPLRRLGESLSRILRYLP